MPSTPLLANQVRLQRVIFALFLLILCGLVGLYVYLDFHRIRTTENEKLATQATVVSLNVEQHITSIDRMIEEILALQQFVDIVQQRDHIQSLVNAIPIIRSIIVLDRAGWQVMGTRDQNNGSNFSHRPYFQSVLADPQPLKLHISPPYLTLRGDLSIALSKAIFDSDGRLQGVVMVALEPSYLRRLMESTLYAADMWAALRHINGDKVIRVMGGIPGEQQDSSAGELGLKQWPPVDGRDAPLIVESQEAGAGLQLVATSTIAGYSAVEALPLQVIMGRDYDSAMTNWRRAALLQGMLLALLMVTTTAGLIFLQRRQARDTSRRTAYLRRIRRDQQRIQATERDFRIIVERTTTCIVRLDTQGRFSYVNPAFCNLFGLSEQEAIGLDFSSLVPENHIASIRLLVDETLQQLSEQQFRAACTTPHGTLHMEWALCSVVDPTQTMQGVIGIGHDISSHINLHEELRVLAERDGLTGLYNRRHFLENGSAQTAHAHRYQQALAIMALDLDHFKKVNDTYGHHAGDLALQTCARLMQQACRESDIPARIGGEEFAILLPGTPIEGAILVANRLRASIEQQAVVLDDGSSLRLTASFGVATLEENDTIDSLLQRADKALYAAKKNGRNRVEAGQAHINDNPTDSLT